MKKRGRPPNASRGRVAELDAIIVRTVRQLLLWGFNLRSECCPAVAVAIAALGRTDSYGRALSDERIEQIYRRTFLRDPVPAARGWITASSGSEFIGLRRPLISIRDIRSLRIDRPVDWKTRRSFRLNELLASLMETDGHWPVDEHSRSQDEVPQYTKKAPWYLKSRPAFAAPRPLAETELDLATLRVGLEAIDDLERRLKTG